MESGSFPNSIRLVIYLSISIRGFDNYLTMRGRSKMIFYYAPSFLLGNYFISSLTSLKHFTIKSMSSFVWLAHTCVRILAFPFGTTG